jgi:hypothetical protein
MHARMSAQACTHMCVCTQVEMILVCFSHFTVGNVKVYVVWNAYVYKSVNTPHSDPVYYHTWNQAVVISVKL